MYLNHVPSALNQDQEIFVTDDPSYGVTDAEDFFDSVLYNNSNVSILAENIEDAVCDGEWLGTLINITMGVTEDDVQRTAELIHEACQ